jgi:hypothetical protein
VVAVKMFEALRLDQADEKVLNELRTEAQMMERLSNHPGIVKFVGAITKGWLISAQPQFFLPPLWAAFVVSPHPRGSVPHRRRWCQLCAGDGVLSARLSLRPSGT